MIEITDMTLAKYFTFSESKNMPVYNWVYYKEGYSPKVVDYAIKYANIKPEKIIDPFCGVGTTLLRAKELNANTIGVDISPLACIITKVKTRNYDKEDINKLKNAVDRLRAYVNSPAKNKEEWIKFELFPISTAFPNRNISFLNKIKQAIYDIEEEWIKQFFETAVISIIPQISTVIKDGGVLKISKRKRAAYGKYIFFRKVKKMIKEAGTIKGPEPEVYIGDARQIDKLVEPGEGNMVITSPPYMNNVDYTKVYGLELSFMGIDPRKLRRKMFRSFRLLTPNNKYHDEKYPIIDMYIKDIKQLISGLKNITPKGAVGIVIGDAVIEGNVINIAKKTGEAMESEGFKNVKIIKGAERIADVKPKPKRVGEYLIIGEG